MGRRLALASPLVLLLFALVGCFGTKAPEPAPTSAGILSGITTITSTPLPPCITPSTTATVTGSETATVTSTATGSATATGTAPALATLVPTLCATPTVPSSVTATAGASGTPGGSATPRASTTPSGSQTPAAGATSAPGTYTVKDGDSIGSIAVALNTTSQALIDANNLSDPNLITVGQVLKVPAASGATPGATPASAGAAAAATGTPRAALPTSTASATSAATGGANTIVAGTPATGGAAGGQTYTVQSGDTACKIATSFKVSLDGLASANSTTSDALSNLQVGQVLKIPASTGSTPSGC